MSIVNDLDRIAAWLTEEIAKDVKLKPMSVDAQTTSEHYELVNPVVFPLYVPTEKTKPPNVVATTPSICVQIVEGSDDMTAGARELKLRLSFSAWDPGLSPQDIFIPTDEPASQFGWRYLRGDDYAKSGDDDAEGDADDDQSDDAEDKSEPVVLSHEGWRDVWNFVDRALRVIESAENLGGLPLVRKQPLKFGVYTQDDGIADFYPFWFAWVELSATERIIRSRPLIDEYL